MLIYGLLGLSKENDLCLFPRQTIQYHSNLSLSLTTNAKKAKVEQFMKT